MFSSTKWVRTVVAMGAIVTAIAGAFLVVGHSAYGPTRPQPMASHIAPAPDPETTSSVLKMMNQSNPLAPSKR